MAQNSNSFSHPPSSAYPCAVPLPGTYTYNPQHGTFFLRFFAFIIATVFIISTIFFVLHPRPPQFHVDTVSLTSPFNLTFHRLSTSFDIGFTARNPNWKISLNYHDVHAALLYRGESLAETYMAPFVQGKKVKSQLKSSFVVANTFGDSDDVGRRINEEMGRGNGNVGFSIKIVADVGFKVGIWRVRRKMFKVYCGDFVVSVMANGKWSSGLTGGPRQCSVGLCSPG